MRFTCLQLVLFVQGLLQSWAMTQCESDQTAHFQTKPEVQVLKGALEQEAIGRSCDEHSFNAGSCGKNECQGCAPWGSNPEIPTNATGFPSGKLLCGENACIYAGQHNPYVYDFKNPSDYLDCRLNACRFFRAKDVSGLCCLNGCQRANIQLASAGGDVCCYQGSAACDHATLTNVGSMACIGDSTCNRATATLTGDLMVSGQNAGQYGKYTFKGSSHCLRFIATNTIRPAAHATFTFDQSSKIIMHCEGANSCQNSNVNVKVPDGSCLHVKCDGPDSCVGFQVSPTGATSNFHCYCSGNFCSWANSYSYCGTTTVNPCGADICPGKLPGCVKDETALAAKSVDCTGLASTARASADAATVAGDPHLRTLDGRHYTLMQQGNFLLWSFSGYETEVLVERHVRKNTRKVPLDFEILAHYAGHASFTKGLLLVDKSSMPTQPPQALEVTAKDCRWHHRDAGASAWRPVESVLLNLADSDGNYGSFNLSMSKGSQKKLEISINHEGEIRTLAQLWVSCKAGHQLSVKMKMPSKKDMHFVQGELAPGRLSLATTGEFEDDQMTTDPEFALTSDWSALGGSPTAASYFTAVDATGPAGAFKACGEAEKAEHAKTCQKYLADSAVSMGSWYQQVVTDCMFDLCHGGDETSAELAAEILNA